MAYQSYYNGRLNTVKTEAIARLGNCMLCPRRCKVNRLANETGVCRTGRLAKVASFGAHFGEEPPLVGHFGSGTIFFSHCNLLCNFCQNFDISHEGVGEEVFANDLAALMLELQKAGCHNINLVTPSHVIPQIVEAVEIAVEKGLAIPLVYNTGGYDEVDSLKRLEGIIDIYMPDFKFWDADVAEITCHAPDYPEVTREAIREMHRQVGDLVIINGIAVQGLLVRHLVMPEGKAGTREVARFLAREISEDTYVNVMAQYRPCGNAYEVPWLSRRITRMEHEEAIKMAREEGLKRIVW